MADKSIISAEHKMAAAVQQRAARFEESTITLVDGSVWPKGALYQILPPLERAKSPELEEFCNYVLFKHPLNSQEAIRLARQVDFEHTQDGFNQLVKKLVGKSFKAHEGGMVFDDSEFLAKLQPEEIEMMRSGETNIKTFMERRATTSAAEARTDRLVRETNEIPVYVRELAQHRISEETPPSTSLELVKACQDVGIDPSWIEHMEEVRRNGIAQKPLFTFFEFNKR